MGSAKSSIVAKNTGGPLPMALEIYKFKLDVMLRTAEIFG